MTLLNPGDRVTRPSDVYAQSSPIMHGTVVYRYATVIDAPERGIYADPEVYAVRWDHDPAHIQRGYFPHGLDPDAP